MSLKKEKKNMFLAKSDRIPSTLKEMARKKLMMVISVQCSEERSQASQRGSYNAVPTGP